MKHWYINKEDSTYARLNEIYGLLCNLRTAYVAAPGNIAAPEEFYASAGGMKCRLVVVVVFSKIY